MKEDANNRRYPRLPKPGKIRVNWRDPNGFSYQVNARIVDICRLGARLELEKNIEPMTLVHVQSQDLHLAGVAVIRHCSRKGLAWVAGLQFAGGLEWFRPQEAGTV